MLSADNPYPEQKCVEALLVMAQRGRGLAPPKDCTPFDYTATPHQTISKFDTHLKPSQSLKTRFEISISEGSKPHVSSGCTTLETYPSTGSDSGHSLLMNCSLLENTRTFHGILVLKSAEILKPETSFRRSH